MNPLKLLPIYGKDVSGFYQKSDNVRVNLSPHIYATAENCYREMIRTEQSQCILISGNNQILNNETLNLTFIKILWSNWLIFYRNKKRRKWKWQNRNL